MKTYSNKSVSKLVSGFDNELKNILMNDLKAMRAAKDQTISKLNYGLNQGSLSAA